MPLSPVLRPEKETEALVARVHWAPQMLVTGDTGSGKSSLVRACLVPRFRGGALALLDGARSEDTIWHVLIIQLRNQPFRQLVRRALRCDLASERAQVLLVSFSSRNCP